MKNTRRFTSAAVLAGSLFAASAASAAVINISDFSLTPDGTNATPQQITNVNALNLNGDPAVASNVLSGSGQVAYVVTTFTFGTGSDAHFRAHFSANTDGSAARVGIQMDDAGLIQPFGDSAGRLIDYDALIDAPNRTTVNLNTDVAGQTFTFIMKMQFDLNNSVLYNARFNNAPSTAMDTLMNVWINPTTSATEGSGPAAGDFYTLWNSSNFGGFVQRIENQGTPGSAGDSAILNTTILTGSDATFANALALAIPEPSTALLGGLGMLALLRRRRA